jgi:hypothetical protein
VSVDRTVHAEQHGGAGDAVSVQQIDERDEMPDSARPAPGDRGSRQLGLLVLPLGERGPADVAGRQAGALECDGPCSVSSSTSGIAASIRSRASSATATIARSSDSVSSRVRPEPVLQAEALDAAEEDRGAARSALEEVDDRVRGEPVVAAIALAEVQGSA